MNTHVIRAHLECLATPTSKTTQSTKRALRTAMVTGHRNCSILSPIPIAPARLIPLRGFLISILRLAAITVLFFMLARASSNADNIVLLPVGSSKASSRAVMWPWIFCFNVASIVPVWISISESESIIIFSSFQFDNSFFVVFFFVRMGKIKYVSWPDFWGPLSFRQLFVQLL